MGERNGKRRKEKGKKRGGKSTPFLVQSVTSPRVVYPKIACKIVP